MKPAAAWKIWLVFAGVFLAGGIAGGFISLRLADRIVERGRAQGQFAPRLLNHLTERLELTEVQHAEVRVMVEAAWQEMQAQRQAGPRGGGPPPDGMPHREGPPPPAGDPPPPADQ